MATLYMLCGVPASGKSYWCNHNLTDNDVYVSRDIVRFSMVKPNESYFSKEDAVFKEFIRQIKEGLAAGKNVYADATHLNRSSRAKTMRAVGRGNWDFQALVFIASLDGCIRRNAGRSGRTYVPEENIEQMFHKFTIPASNEGFSKIWKMEVD